MECWIEDKTRKNPTRKLERYSYSTVVCDMFIEFLYKKKDRCITENVSLNKVCFDLKTDFRLVLYEMDFVGHPEVGSHLNRLTSYDFQNKIRLAAKIIRLSMVKLFFIEKKKLKTYKNFRVILEHHSSVREKLLRLTFRRYDFRRTACVVLQIPSTV